VICGIDIGGTKLLLVVFDDELRAVHSSRAPTPGHSYGAFLDSLASLVRAADEFAGRRLPLGLAFPGIIASTGEAISTNVPCINGQPVIADLEQALARPVAHLNDVRAFALSESQGGALATARVGMGLVLGTGVAGVLCIDGCLHSGSQGIAGEYGHMPLPRHLLAQYRLPKSHCRCGTDGCVEAYLSGPGLVRIGRAFGTSAASAERLLKQAQEGCAKAQAARSAWIDCLGYFVSRVTLLVDPHVVVLGGGLSGVALLYRTLPAATEAHLFDGLRPPLIRAPRFGAQSGARGAAVFAKGLCG